VQRSGGVAPAINGGGGEKPAAAYREKAQRKRSEMAKGGIVSGHGMAIENRRRRQAWRNGGGES